jgi:hypothetical protein
MGGKSKFGAPPLMTWVTGKKSFDESLRTSGSPLEQSINKGVLKAIGHGPKGKKKGGGSSSGVDSTTGMMMQYMSQMQAQQASQAEAARQAQEAAFIESQKQAAASAAQQGELGSQQVLEQTGAMQQARDITAKEAQQRAYGAIGQSAVGEGFDINQAKQQQLSNIAGTGNIPYTSSAKLPFYGYNQNQDSGATGKYANIFSMPKTKGLTLGGI